MAIESKYHCFCDCCGCEFYLKADSKPQLEDQLLESGWDIREKTHFCHICVAKLAQIESNTQDSEEVEQGASSIKPADESPEKKEFLNEREVSSLIGMSLSTLRAQRFQSKGIPYIKVGRSVRYQYSDVMNFMKGHKINLPLW